MSKSLGNVIDPLDVIYGVTLEVILFYTVNSAAGTDTKHNCISIGTLQNAG